MREGALGKISARLSDQQRMIKAIARSGGAECWTTIAEIVAAEKINVSYVGRVLWLTFLAPE
jgi:hypothetical protein